MHLITRTDVPAFYFEHFPKIKGQIQRSRLLQGLWGSKMQELFSSLTLITSAWRSWSLFQDPGALLSSQRLWMLMLPRLEAE